MAALRKTDRGSSASMARDTRISGVQSSKILTFAQKAYEKTGGPTEGLRRVYAAYLENQKKAQNKA